MFRLFRRSSVAKLEKQYRQKLDRARCAQRSGKIPLYATLTAEAEILGRQLDQARARAAGDNDV